MYSVCDRPRIRAESSMGGRRRNTSNTKAIGFLWWSLRLLVFDPLDFNVVADELVNVRDDRRRLDVHQNKGRYDVAVLKETRDKNIDHIFSRNTDQSPPAGQLCSGWRPSQFLALKREILEKSRSSADQIIINQFLSLKVSQERYDCTALASLTDKHYKQQL